MENSFSFPLELIHENFDIECHVCNQTGSIASTSSGFFAPQMAIFTDFYHSMQSDYEKHMLPELHFTDSNIMFAGFSIDEELLCVIGPFSCVPIPQDVLFQFYHGYKIPEGFVPVPLIPAKNLCPMLSAIAYLISNRQYSAQEIETYNFSSNHSLEELTMYKIDNELMERQHLTYEYENQWLTALENGTAEEAQVQDTLTSTSEDSVGVLAKGDQQKQMDYSIVAGITLATRAAIRGGVAPYEAYATSDLLLQQLANCKDAMERYTLFTNALNTFGDAVKKVKKNERQNPHIEQCKDYIGRHLHSNYTIKELADVIGVSEAYLSRLFSQCMGTTLHQYILDTRLEASANMLRVAPASIGEITEYFCFCSPSHFGKCFQKKYGMTPSQYRTKYRVINASDPIRKI